MRCKNCKKKIENPNFLRCPHCGKPIQVKKKADPKQLIMGTAFTFVCVLFVIVSFFSFFFKCDYYSTPVMIIAAVVLMIAVPFIFGNYSGVKPKAAEIITAAVSIPFIVNWAVVFIGHSESLDRGGLYSAYYISILLTVLASDVLLLLKAAGAIKNGKIICWIVLSLGIAAAAFSIFFYVYIGAVKPFAIMIITVQSFTPGYLAFHVLMKAEQGSNADALNTRR